jgi:hypothetical protein
MIFDRRIFLVLPLAAAVAAAGASGCGNYSNEDLEFMNALPERDELQANIPDRSSSISPADEAELSRMTHDVTRNFNGLLALLVGMVDTVRSYPPTTRTPDSRIWGPFATDRRDMKNLDWQWRMIVSRDPITVNRFDYEIATHKVGTADTEWPIFIRGWFEAGKTARRGNGHVELVTANVRAAGLDVSDLNMLDHLEITYDTTQSPISISMHATNLPDPITLKAASIDYTYNATAEGQGQMTFDVFGPLIPPPPGSPDQDEDLRVTSQWLSSGAGRGRLLVVSGDGMGSQQVECWDRSFRATFNDKPWGTPAENVVADPADPSVCPDIPLL